MRIIVDVTSTLLRSSGVKNFVYFWARALEETAGRHSLSYYPFLRNLGTLNHEGSNQPRVVTSVAIQIMNVINLRGNFLRNLPFRNADLVHISPHMRLAPAGPKITAPLYDMSCWTVPETHQPANVRATKKYAETILTHADGIIAISASARDDAVRILDIPEDRFAVVHPGVSPSFFGVSQPQIDSVREHYGFNKPYVLSLGTIEPRKNLDLLLDAYGSLPESLRHEYPLVVAGPLGWSSPATIARLQAADAPWRYLGYVPEEHLPGLTAGAAMFVFPSLYEGFGLPLAQAMAARLPCITSNISSMPEIAGDGALLIDPHSKSELQQALSRLLLSPSGRAQLAERASVQAQQYTWENAAHRTWRFFERLCGEELNSNAAD